MSEMILDVNESAFFLRELEYVKKKTYDKKYKKIRYPDLLPVSTEADAEAAQITYQKFTKVGLSKVIAFYADDAPNVDVYGEEVTVKVKRVGNSFGYDRQEVKQSLKTGKRLNQRKAATARLATEQKLNRIAWTGDAAHNIQGFIDYPGITEYTVPVGASTSKLWSTKTPDEIIADLAGIVTDGIIDPTNGVGVPDTIILPIAQYELIANTRVTDGDSNTILNFFLDNNPHIKQIEWLTELKGAGAGGTDRYMAYSKDPNNVTFELTQPFTFLPPEARNYGFKVLTETFTAGVIVYFPLEVAYGDGI